MKDDAAVLLLTEIRNWTRAASYKAVKALLEDTLKDTKSRTAYQMFDGKVSQEQVRLACKMSPNVVSALVQRCTALGLMEVRDDKRRMKLFDLSDFQLITPVMADEKEQ